MGQGWLCVPTGHSWHQREEVSGRQTSIPCREQLSNNSLAQPRTRLPSISLFRLPFVPPFGVNKGQPTRISCQPYNVGAGTAWHHSTKGQWKGQPQKGQVTQLIQVRARAGTQTLCLSAFCSPLSSIMTTAAKAHVTFLSQGVTEKILELGGPYQSLQL